MAVRLQTMRWVWWWWWGGVWKWLHTTVKRVGPPMGRTHHLKGVPQGCKPRLVHRFQGPRPHRLLPWPCQHGVPGSYAPQGRHSPPLQQHVQGHVAVRVALVQGVGPGDDHSAQDHLPG